MADIVKTFGEAADRGMMFRVVCAGCSRSKYFIARDLARFWGRETRIDQHRFKCRECQPPMVKVTALVIDLDRKPSGHVMRFCGTGTMGERHWRREKFRG